MEPHDEFLELCALVTSGELSEQEKRELEDHLAFCAECRQALQEFQAAVDVGVPFLAEKLSASQSSDPSEQFTSRQSKSKQVASPDRAAPSHPDALGAGVAAAARERGFVFAQRNGHEHTKINWNYVWLPFAACILLSIALGIYSYRISKSRSVQVSQPAAPASDVQIEALEGQMSDVGHEREDLRLQLAQRDKVISDLRHQIQTQAASLDEMKSSQANLEKSIQSDDAEKQQNAQDQGTLLQKLAAAEVSLEKAQAQLNALERQRGQDESRAASLGAQVNDLHAQLREREQVLSKQDDLLAHDRDVRELMGARELHIEDIYNVAGDRVTQKPYGRVFYTKGKSLVFYAYDLDQQAGVRNARTFQAWGRRGPDRRQAANLGIFYEDDAAKKRWVVKFDDAKTLEQIDAVFVTVEPNGGSSKPSGSPLLFTYLKIEPNHP
jgi:anti-sigma factor RsiW